MVFQIGQVGLERILYGALGHMPDRRGASFLQPFFGCPFSLVVAGERTEALLVLLPGPVPETNVPSIGDVASPESQVFAFLKALPVWLATYAQSLTFSFSGKIS